jgi:hypothetical protein
MTDNKRVVGLDIDDTITAHPHKYASLSLSEHQLGNMVVIISSRFDTPIVRAESVAQLADLNIYYDHMYLFKPFDDMDPVCPHEDLDWQDQYLWQKVAYAKAAGVTEHHDDDDRVITLFKRFAPEIRMVDAKTLA